MYECHHKTPRLASNALFTCQHCGTSTDRLATHCNHLAHHYSPSLTELVRIFSCVYCDCQSDSIEMLEKHVVFCHPDSEMKYQVRQSTVNYLQVSYRGCRCGIISSCQSAATFEIVKALLVTILSHVRSAIASTGLYLYLYL